MALAIDCMQSKCPAQSRRESLPPIKGYTITDRVGIDDRRIS
jgi:hypothetical protein